MYVSFFLYDMSDCWYISLYLSPAKVGARGPTKQAGRAACPKMCAHTHLLWPTPIKYVYISATVPKAPLRAQTHAEGTSHYFQSSNSSSHPVPFAVGVLRSSWSQESPVPAEVGVWSPQSGDF